MRLEDLKQFMLLPKEEYIINKSMNIRGKDIILLSLTMEKEESRLWLIYEQDNALEDELEGIIEREEFSSINMTNREDRHKAIEENNRDRHFYIEKIVIQDQVITFDSSSSIQIYEANIEGMMHLQHFIEKGLILSKWNDKKINNLVISQYRQSQGETGLIIDTNKPMDIKIGIGQDTKEIPIGYIFKANFGKQNTEISYYDKEFDSKETFYINEIYSFDPHEYIKTSVEKIEDLETRKEIFENLTEAAERVYPRNKNLAVIKYESKNDIQLNFYMKDFLDTDLKDNYDGLVCEDGISAASVGFIWSSKENSLGVNGHKLRECVLQPIDKDFNGKLEIELFSRYQQIPGEML